MPTSALELNSLRIGIPFDRRFIATFSHIARPLHKLSNQAPFFWTSLANKQLKRLKEALCSAPVLRFPDLHQPSKIEMDASRHAIGAVLK